MTMLRMLNSSDFASLEHQATFDASIGLSNVSLSDLQKDNNTMQLQQRYRARKKQERLRLIQEQILQRLRGAPYRQSNQNASTAFSQEDRSRMQQIFERMHQLHQLRNDGNDLHPGHLDQSNHVHAERFQSFYPACNPPNHTDRELWDMSGTLRLYYPISFPTRVASSMTETTVLSAKLRLHKRAGTTGPAQQEEANCVDCAPLPSSYPTFLLPSAPTLTVSIYHFVKPLRQHRREKKRLVDSRIISADQEGWLEFNVEPSLHQWFHNRHRNFGLDIEVDDALGNKLDPKNFFQNVNCSDPSDMAENESSIFDNETYPTLDLQTAEFSRHHLLQQQHQLEGTREGEPHMETSDQQRFVRKRHTHSGHVYLTPSWNQHCKRETVYVSFQELGLESRVLEGGLKVNYCTSRRRSEHGKGDAHNSHGKTAECCEATSYVPLHFHYLDEDGSTHPVTLNTLSARHCTCAIS